MSHKEQGLRFNNGKLRMDLIPHEAMTGLAKVLTLGAEKYAPRNWEKGMSWTSVLASLKRHLTAFEAREDVDTETGLSHIDHVLCNAAFLAHYIKNHPDYDDRPLPFYLTKKVALDIDGVMADFTSKLEEVTGENVVDYGMSPTQRVIYESLKDDESFWDSIKPLDNNMSKCKWRPYCYITARPESSRAVTARWLSKHGFPNVPLFVSVNATSKLGMMDELGVDILIEDNPLLYLDSLTQNKCVFLYDQVYNRYINAGHKRLTSLTQLFSNER